MRNAGNIVSGIRRTKNIVRDRRDSSKVSLSEKTDLTALMLPELK